MSGHPSFRSLRAVDHGELPPSEERELFEHVDGCTRCRDELATIRDVRDGAAAATAVELPDLWPGIRDRVEAGEVVLLPSVDDEAGDAPRRRDGGSPGSRPVAVAALALLLVTAAGALAGTVGPLRGWVEAVLTGSAPADPPAPAASTAGIDVPVPAGGLTVELRDVGSELILRLGPGEGAMAEIVATGSAAPDFRSGPDRVVVAGAVGGRIDVRVPDGAARVRVVADGVTVAEVRQGLVLPRGGMAGRELEARVDQLVQRATEASGEPGGTVR